MTDHIFLPHVKLKEIQLVQVHQEWLFGWLSALENEIEDGDVSASLCLQGILSELAIYGAPKTDWIGVMEEYLTDHDGMPLAYSEKYGERLYRFNFWLQSPVHAVHCRWFAEQVCHSLPRQTPKYADLITALIQPNGWIYNPKVSVTRQRNRMKSEYMMSMAMGCEILASANRLSKYAQQFQAILSSAPLTDFLSAEYFRLKALSILQTFELAPAGLAGLLSKCKIELGFSEFAIASKVDDYMGTAKRTARDKPISSPLIGLYANAIARFCPNDLKESVVLWLKAYGGHLKEEPFDVQAFRIRDEDISFGTDLSPLEIIAASFLIANVN
jgi:hypothetical protein